MTQRGVAIVYAQSLIRSAAPARVLLPPAQTYIGPCHQVPRNLAPPRLPTSPLAVRRQAVCRTATTSSTSQTRADLLQQMVQTPSGHKSTQRRSSALCVLSASPAPTTSGRICARTQTSAPSSAAYAAKRSRANTTASATKACTRARRSSSAAATSKTATTGAAGDASRAPTLWAAISAPKPGASASALCSRKKRKKKAAGTASSRWPTARVCSSNCPGRTTGRA